jgi:hypothetical protein
MFSPVYARLLIAVVTTARPPLWYTNSSLRVTENVQPWPYLLFDLAVSSGTVQNWPAAGWPASWTRLLSTVHVLPEQWETVLLWLLYCGCSLNIAVNTARWDYFGIGGGVQNLWDIVRGPPYQWLWETTVKHYTTCRPIMAHRGSLYSTYVQNVTSEWQSLLTAH